MVCQYASDMLVLLADQLLSNLSRGCSQTAEIITVWCESSLLGFSSDKTGLLVFSKIENNRNRHMLGGITNHCQLPSQNGFWGFPWTHFPDDHIERIYSRFNTNTISKRYKRSV